jgi:TorA maturation chaperone TorD
MMQRAAGALVFHTPQETPIAALLELMRPSLAAMPTEKGFAAEVEKATEKLQRAKETPGRGHR